MATITSANVQYNMDFIGYLVQQEQERRQSKGQKLLTKAQLDDFKRDLIRHLIIRRDAQAAINARPMMSEAKFLTETT
jgi:hypothetical protein